MCTAFYVIFSNIKKANVSKQKEFNVLFDEDTIVDELISQLIEKNEIQVNIDKTKQGKQDILETFVTLHRSGSFCAQLTEQEVIYFVKKKLNMEIKENG
jgi:ribosomal protein L17